MKRKIWVTAGIAAALAFLIAFGAVGCVVSGFDLPLDSYAKVVLICGAASVFCAAAFSLKWGGAAVLCALALGAGYVWKQDEAAEQLFGLLYRMTTNCGRSARIMAAIPALPPTCAGPWSGCGSKLLQPACPPPCWAFC